MKYARRQINIFFKNQERNHEKQIQTQMTNSEFIRLAIKNNYKEFAKVIRGKKVNIKE